MKAICFETVERVRHDDVPDATIVDATDALVRVEAAGLCGSDLHVFHGRETGLDAGTVMGHEFVGVIVAVGRDVESFRPGDRVMSPFTTSCGRCAACRRGLTARCVESELFGWVQDGHGLHGGQAELVRVPNADGTLVRLPDDISAEAALLLGDNLPTARFAAVMAGVEENPGGAYLVLGCGAVGLLAIASARALGAERIWAHDPVVSRLARAERLGATGIASAEKIVEIMRGEGGGAGADAVMELVGSPAAQRLAFDALRPGGTLAVVGVHTSPSFAFSPAEAYDKNVTYRTGRCSARAAMEALVPLARDGLVPVDEIFTHRMGLEQAAEAYSVFAGREADCVKVAFRF